jgi:hypothetical protein
LTEILNIFSVVLLTLKKWPGALAISQKLGNLASPSTVRGMPAPETLDLCNLVEQQRQNAANAIGVRQHEWQVPDSCN